MASITNTSAMTRPRESWPLHRAKKRKRNRERRTVAQRAQAKRDADQRP